MKGRQQIGHLRHLSRPIHHDRALARQWICRTRQAARRIVGQRPRMAQRVSHRGQPLEQGFVGKRRGDRIGRPPPAA